METLQQDIKFGLRMLRKGGWVTFAALLVLSLVIGVNTGIFSIVDRVLWRPPVYGSSSELVRLWESYGLEGWGSVSPANFSDWQDQNKAFVGMAAYMYGSRNLQNVDIPERLRSISTSANIFSILDCTPLLGRTFVADDDLPDRPGVVILSEGLWRRRFAGDKKLLGQTITLDGTPHVVIGVMPASFEFPPAEQVDLWTTLQLPPAQRQTRGSHFLSVIGRLKPGVSPASALTEMKGIASRIEEQFPQQQKGRSVRMQGLIDSVTGGSKLPLLLLLGAVGMVLLIASANVASMVLARTAARTRELSVRLALGAPKRRLIRQLFVESFVLVFASSVVGLGVAVVCTRVLASLAALQIPFVGNVQFDLRVFGALFLLTSLTGLVFGLGSGLQGFRLNMLKGLKEGPTQVGIGRGLSRIYSFVVIAEVALSVFLLIGSGLLVRTFLELRAVKPGFESANVLTAQISLPKKEYANGVAMGHFYGLIQDKMQTVPGVQSAGLVSLLPMQDWGVNGSFGIQGRPTQETSTPPTAEIRIVSSDYFKTLGIPFKAGRPLSAQDQASSPHVVLVNETLQRKYFSEQSPIGQYLLLPEPWQIVGVVADVKQTRLDRETLAELYLPYTQIDEVPLLTDMTLVLKTRVPPLSLVSTLRNAVAAVDKNQPIYNVSTMDDVVSSSVAGLRLYVSLATGFAVLALILAIAGVYGMISYTTAQRTREFGLRVAMGAQKRDLVFMVLTQQMAKVAFGIGVGVCASFVFVRILTSALFGVKPTDPLTFSAVCLLVCTISFVASYLPARRASQVDAMSSLRYE